MIHVFLKIYLWIYYPARKYPGFLNVKPVDGALVGVQYKNPQEHRFPYDEH